MQQYVDIIPIPFQNDDPINVQLENTGKTLVALQPKSLLYYVVYSISKGKLINSILVVDTLEVKKVIGNECYE